MKIRKNNGGTSQGMPKSKPPIRVMIMLVLRFILSGEMVTLTKKICIYANVSYNVLNIWLQHL